MEFESARRVQPQINLSALIDIVFILVIFVVLAANFQRLRGIEVDLPNAAASSDAPTEALVVSIERSGAIDIQGEKVPPAEVQGRLRALREGFDGLVIRADGGVALEVAVRVLSDARLAGFDGVSIATKER